MTSQLHRLVVVAAAGATLAGCTTVVAGRIEPTDLPTALAVEVPGFAPSDAPPLPDGVCREGSYSGNLPGLDSALGTPTATGYRAEDSELGVWAWRMNSPDTAEAIVGEATDRADACAYDLYYDSDTDGDGDLDAGGHEQQSARAWSDETWDGLAVSARTEGGGVEVAETRFVRSGDVVLLVVLTSTDGGTDSLPATVEAYLDGVAGRLG
jgi:hypothetical protein